MTFEKALADVLGELGVEADTPQIAQLCGHFDLLQKWNRRINLTAVRDPAVIALRHYGESAFLHRELPLAASAVDVGSGAGFPGIPFAILRPLAAVTLVESKRKKAAFLREAARAIPNVSVRDCRIDEWTGTAAWALLRAVSPARVMASLSGRVDGVALLGTEPPPDGPFGPWAGQPLPWGERKKLWTAKAR